LNSLLRNFLFFQFVGYGRIRNFATIFVSSIPQKIFVGFYMEFPIKIAMLDDDGMSMTEVGYNGDPMRVTATTNAPLENNVATFTPGTGVASFDRTALEKLSEFYNF